MKKLIIVIHICIVLFGVEKLSAHTYEELDQFIPANLLVFGNSYAIEHSGGVFLKIKNDVLEVVFGGGYGTSYELKYGKIIKIQSDPKLPDFDIGAICYDGPIPVTAQIKDGYLYIDHVTYQSFYVRSFNHTFYFQLNGNGTVQEMSTTEGRNAFKGNSLCSNQNYIHTSIALKKTQDIDGYWMGPEDKLETVQYFDGLGRLQQSVSVGNSSTGKDIIQPTVYDRFGRESKKYLPYVADKGRNGIYRNSMIKEVLAYYSADQARKDHTPTSTPYSQTVFEESSLNRILEQGAAGDDWQPLNSICSKSGHTLKMSYGSNAQNDVLWFGIDGDGNLKKKGYYPKNSLYRTVTKNENWTTSDGKINTTEDFKDKMGQIVLKRGFVKEGSNVCAVETYYVYNKFGLLQYVIPPKAVDILNNKAPIAKDTNSQFVQTPIKRGKEESSITKYYIDGNGSVTLTSGFSFKASAGKSFSITSGSAINGLCYQYKYDALKRMIEKQLPGAKPVYMVYDNRDRLVATQDGNQRAGGKTEWTFTKYDAFNRPIATGIVSKSNRGTIEKELEKCDAFETVDSNKTNSHGYTNTSWPKGVSYQSFLSVTYYDNYDMGIPSDFKWDATKYNTKVKGQVTASREKVLGTNSYLWNVTYYDKKYRPIRVCSDLYIEGKDAFQTVDSDFDFVGKVDRTIQKQYIADATTTITEEHKYDHVGRLKTTTQTISQTKGSKTITHDPIVLVSNTYNELGQLVNKKVGNGKQQMDYQYNIRGWLTKINNPNSTKDITRSFGMELAYNTTLSDVTSKEQWNGNISGMTWNAKTPTQTPTEAGTTQTYGYSYDGLNRLREGDYKGGTKFDVKINGYDKNGNITSLTRNGVTGSAIDNLTYYYVGNQLSSLTVGGDKKLGYTGTSGSFAYDANGNMTKDNTKGFTVAYNALNLPKQVSKGSEKISYLYSASGAKLEKQKTDGKTNVSYAGNCVYEDGSLKYILTSEGRVLANASGFTYEYHLKDHLGNVRVVVNEAGKVTQSNDYYPFGLTFAGASHNGNTNKYLYNGKELQDDKIGGSSLDWLDFHARMYMADLGRTTTMDTHAENYYDWSPYHFVANNPMRVTDPTGKDWETERDEKIAKGMQKGLENQESSLNKRLTKLENDAAEIESNDKLSDEKKDKKLATNARRQESVKSSISDVQTAQTELKIMGKTDKMTFSFNNLGSEATTGYLSSKANGVVVINHNGTLGMKAHETKHAFQAYIGMVKVIPGTVHLKVSPANRYKYEVQGYRRQFSITGSTRFPDSDTGRVKYFHNIDENWIKGIKDEKDNYLYR